MHRPLRGLAAAACCTLLSAAPAYAVVGGKDAPAHVYDAVASVAIAGAEGCTGTLVAPDWVLTAGHCGSVTGGLTGGALGTPIGWPPGTVTVTLGTTAASGAGGERIDAANVIVSPRYTATRGQDVALLQLAHAARATPVRIAGTQGAAIWAPGTLATIAGFGATSERGDYPERMQVAQVPIVADETCRGAYPTSFEPATQLCAGYAEGGVDSCQGDSGGPLFGHDAAKALVLVGATSYGDGCARPGRYGIYARIADTTLREWIRSVVPAAIDDAATATAEAPADGGTSATTPARLRLLALRRSARGSRLTVQAPRGGRLTVTWRANGRTGRRVATLRAGRRTLTLLTPRAARRVAVRATLRPASGAALTARAVLRVR